MKCYAFLNKLFRSNDIKVELFEPEDLKILREKCQYMLDSYDSITTKLALRNVDYYGVTDNVRFVKRKLIAIRDDSTKDSIKNNVYVILQAVCDFERAFADEYMACRTAIDSNTEFVDGYEAIKTYADALKFKCTMCQSYLQSMNDGAVSAENWQYMYGKLNRKLKRMKQTKV